MRRSRGQNGYASLLALLVLLTGSAACLSGFPPLSHQPSAYTLQPAAIELQSARQALLSYSASYANLYGPAGAGIGHFPCPDTDNQSNNLAPSSGDNDGPDPPCGQTLQSAGRLPRHINLPGQRYAFHALPDQRLDYRVSRRVINNPVNRMVNPALLEAHIDSEPYAALIVHAQKSGGSVESPDFATAVSYKALLSITGPAVVAWFAAHAKSYDGDYCSRYKPHELVIALLADESLSGRLCGPLVLEQISIEKRLATRHWFVRNQWHKWLRVERSPACAGIKPSGCQWVFRQHSTLQREASEPFVVTWAPVP